MTSAISAQGLSKSYGPVKAVVDVHLDVRRGEMRSLCVVGELRAATRLLWPAAAAISTQRGRSSPSL